MPNLQLSIHNKDSGKAYVVGIEEGIKLETERMGAPGKLTFNVIKDYTISFQEGDTVKLIVDDVELFLGYVFVKKRDKDGIIKITAYDQLRYLKNKDTYVYTNKTAAALLKMIANDFNLKCGVIEDTKHTISKKVEDNKTLFDIIQNALDETLRIKKQIYVLYDDFGRLTLKNINNMKLNLLIDENVSEDYDYTSSIDSDTYNQVKLVYENEKTGKREVYKTKHTENINKWGLLQYYETLKEGENGKQKAEALLQLYNRKTRNLSIKGAFGDLRVRAGCTIAVNLNLGDMILSKYMLVEKCTHEFSENQHTMDLVLRGGEFVQ